MAATAHIGLGSNLGDRRDYLDRALQRLHEQPGVEVGPVSGYHDTEPVGGPPGQEDYLNAAAELRTELGADDLLRLLLSVEQDLGRVRSERHGPRTVDLDLLLYGDQVHDQPWLTVPHPLMHERLFVLEPLAEIAPLAVHPVFECTVRDLLWKLRVNQAHSAPTIPSPQPPDVGPRHALALPRREPGEQRPARELEGLRALVTGSTSGIGQAIALELASAGADVIVHGRRSSAAALAVAERIRATGVRSATLLADLHDVARLDDLVRSAWDEWSALDVWVNNAGADTLTGEAAGWPFARKLQELLAVDVTAAVLLSREVGRRMQQAGSGVILNVGWDQAETGMGGDSGQLFAASKAAVAGFTKSLAVSLAPQVRVNCLAPGWVCTSWGQIASARWQERIRRETPLARWGTPADVAAAARWLASPAASFITGQTIRVNGGAVR